MKQEYSISLEDLLKRSMDAYNLAETQQDPRGMIAAVATIGRLCGFEYEAQARRDDIIGQRIRAALAAHAGRSAQEIVEDSSASAAALMYGVIVGDLPASMSERISAARNILDRTSGMPVSADMMFARQEADKLMKRISAVEDRSNRRIITVPPVVGATGPPSNAAIDHGSS